MEGQTDKNPKLHVQISKIAPKFYAQQCPVCNGFGTLKYGTKDCQACRGTGYIIVPTGMEGNEDGANNKQ